MARIADAIAVIFLIPIAGVGAMSVLPPGLWLMLAFLTVVVLLRYRVLGEVDEGIHDLEEWANMTPIDRGEDHR